MRAEITEVLDGGVVRFASPLGTANATWRGPEPPRIGWCHVELEVPAEVRIWAAVPAGVPELRGTGDQVHVTAQVAAYDSADRIATLRLGDSVVQAEIHAPTPEVRPGACLRLTVENLEFYPLNS